MLSFACDHCGRLVFFANTVCLHCSTPLGFVPADLDLVALEGERAESLHRCANNELAACNWMVTRPGGLCRSCVLTRTRPNDADIDGLARFATAEQAKRRAPSAERRAPSAEPSCSFWSCACPACGRVS
jgi:hypothetical protein